MIIKIKNEKKKELDNFIDLNKNDTDNLDKSGLIMMQKKGLNDTELYFIKFDKKIKGVLWLQTPQKNEINFKYMGIYISPDNRGKGFAKILLRNILKKEKILVVNIEKDNINSLNLFKKYNFKVLSSLEEIKKYKPKEMSKDIITLVRKR